MASSVPTLPASSSFSAASAPYTGELAHGHRPLHCLLLKYVWSFSQNQPAHALALLFLLRAKLPKL